jgi:hypothetical protein
MRFSITEFEPESKFFSSISDGFFDNQIAPIKPGKFSSSVFINPLLTKNVQHILPITCCVSGDGTIIRIIEAP